MAYKTKFNFTGSVMLPSSNSKMKFIKEWEGGKNKDIEMAVVNFGVKESDNNIGFVELFGMKTSEIKTYDKDNNPITIDWEDRFDEEIVSKVANYRKHIVNLGEGYDDMTFITDWDAIEYLKEQLPEYEGKVTVTGDYDCRPSNDGRIFPKFRIQNIYGEPEEKKNRLKMTLDLFYSKDCVDKRTGKDEKKIFIDGYILQYLNNDLKEKYIDFPVVFSSAKYDLENEKHVARLNQMMKYIDVSSKNVVHMVWECVYINGNESVEFDESMLTPEQKMMIEVGLNTVNDFKPKGDIFGKRVREIRLFKPLLIGDYKNGLLDTDIKFKEFDSYIYKPVTDSNETLEDIISDATETATISIENDEEEYADLF